MRKAVFAGTFDPVTLGHENIIKISSEMFDEVIVAICVNEHKTPLFTVEQRLNMLNIVTKKYTNVRCVFHEGLLMELLKKENATYNIRGIRNEKDYLYETKMWEINKKIYEEHVTLFIPCEDKYRDISSTKVRELMEKGKDLKPFLSDEVIKIIN